MARLTRKEWQELENGKFCWLIYLGRKNRLEKATLGIEPIIKWKGGKQNLFIHSNDAVGSLRLPRRLTDTVAVCLTFKEAKEEIREVLDKIVLRKRSPWK